MSLLPPVSNPLLYTTDVSGAARDAVKAADIVAAQAGEPTPAEPGNAQVITGDTSLAPLSSIGLKILLEAQRDFAATQLLPDDPTTPLIVLQGHGPSPTAKSPSPSIVTTPETARTRGRAHGETGTHTPHKHSY